MLHCTNLSKNQEKQTTTLKFGIMKLSEAHIFSNNYFSKRFLEYGYHKKTTGQASTLFDIYYDYDRQVKITITFENTENVFWVRFFLLNPRMCNAKVHTFCNTYVQTYKPCHVTGQFLSFSGISLSIYISHTLDINVVTLRTNCKPRCWWCCTHRMVSCQL